MFLQASQTFREVFMCSPTNEAFQKVSSLQIY
jgi:hypothetical protein